jgi:hypothetical protein
MILKPRPDLVIEIADGELIILDKAAGKVHQLNSSASFVWQCISDGLGAEEIALQLSETFDIERENALADVRAAVAQFEALALIDA